jgi:tRNA(Ile)-lysidine synthase
VERAVRRHRLLARGQAVVVAVSGGGDSVFLLLSLHALAPRLQLALHVAHLDHGWRGASGAADAAFVAALAARLGLPYHGQRVAAPQLARAGRLSPEDAARRLRYAFLRDVCRDVGASTVATGHTQDDQVETILLAWLRGSGPEGQAPMEWAGPLPVPDAAGLRLVRPLLGLSRPAARAALRALDQDWREDATNADLDLPRNRLRLEVLPALESLSPGYRDAVVRAATLSAQAGAYLAQSACRAGAELFEAHGPALRAPRQDFLALDPALRGAVLRWAVCRLQGHTTDLEWAHVQGALETIERGRGGAVAWLSPRLRLRLAQRWLFVEPSVAPSVAPSMEERGTRGE